MYIWIISVCARVGTMVCVWRLDGYFLESVLSFHLYVHSRDWTQVARLAQQVHVPADPAHWPICSIFQNWLVFWFWNAQSHFINCWNFCPILNTKIHFFVLWVHVCAGTCMCRYTCVCMHVEARGQPRYHDQEPSTLFSCDRISHLHGLTPTRPGWLGRQFLASQMGLFLPSQQ